MIGVRFTVQSINQSIKNLSEQMQKHCSHRTSMWEKMWKYYTLGNDGEERQILSWEILSLGLNVDSVTDDVTSDGRLFQVFAAATQNARSLTVVAQNARSLTVVL